MKDFKKLIVWQKSMDLLVDIHKWARKLPAEEKYEMASQLRRAAFSIPANIAEGSSKSTSIHYKHFLEISLGSAYEIETAFLAITRLYDHFREEIGKMLERIMEIQKMLIAFINKIKE